MAPFSNHLIQETSPYLLQHAHNPVDWYPWGEEALAKAKQEDKPILVSIGYSACHWCHVMEKESFEDAETAAIMNEYFVNIKIDREERPDLDHIYMNALQTMTGSGGWPLNVFLTPDRKPFYGGTYYPPQPIHNRPSWQQVLVGVIEAFHERRDKLEKTAESLTGQLVEASNFEIVNAVKIPLVKEETDPLDNIFQQVMRQADRQHGGFGAAPKFPQTFVIRFLLQYHSITGNNEALEQAELSLKKMIQGGIYDHVGGGFARYATDKEWLVPHFEKMLYDNALLVMAMSEAYQLTGNSLYKHTIEHTLEFVRRELCSVEGGFFAALDADSEGVEGKFYVWDKEEIEKLLGQDAALFCRFYDIAEAGNWEHHNILWQPQTVDFFAQEHGVDPVWLRQKFQDNLATLLQARASRVRPGLDDKLLLSWNALMNTAFSKAYAATGTEAYREMAIKNMDFLLHRFFNQQENAWKHVYKNGVAKMPAFLDDYANLIQALISLQEITGNQQYLEKGKDLTILVNEHFSDRETGFYFYTHQRQEDVIMRTKETYDGATPSSNAIMAWNLRYLSLIFDNREWGQRWEKMVTSIASMVIKYPVSFGIWAGLLVNYLKPAVEIAIVGEKYMNFLPDVLKRYLPARVLQCAPRSIDNYPLLKDRGKEGGDYIYYCRDYICEKPVTTVDALMQLIDRKG